MRKGRVLFSLVVVLCAVAGMAFATGGAEAGKAATAPVSVGLFLPHDPQAGQQAVEDALAKYTIPKVNASLKLNWVTWDQWNDKKKLMIASGEEADIYFTAIWLNFLDEIARNAWLPLNDLIDKNVPELRTIVGDFLNGPVLNGKILAIPTVKEKAIGAQFLANKKYADKYGIDVKKIKTLDDLEPWLAKIKQGDPDIAGIFMDPVNTSPVRFEVDFQYENIVGSYPDSFFLDKDGKIKSVYHMDITWDALARAHRWYVAGYIEKDLETRITSSGRSGSQLKDGNWVFFFTHDHPGRITQWMTDPSTSVVPVYASGSGSVMRPLTSQGQLVGSMMSISRTSKHAVEAIKLIGLMNSDKYVNNLLNFGIEGKDYTFADKGKGIIKTIPNSGYSMGYGWALQNQLINYLTETDPPDKWAQYAAYNKSARIGDAVGFFPDVTTVKTELATLDNALLEYRDVLDGGILDPAAVKATVLAKMKDAGVDKIEAELQRQFNAFRAAKK